MRAQRTKIGVILPSSNTTVEADFQRVVPPETSIHSARMWAVGSSVEVLEEMNHDLDQCAKHLGSAAVDIIAYACTGGSLLGGVGFDQKVKQCISEVAGGIPAVPTATAVVEALRSLKIQKVSVVTPYPDDINESLRAFLEGSGFEVLGLFGRGHTLNLDIGADPAWCCKRPVRLECAVIRNWCGAEGERRVVEWDVDYDGSRLTALSVVKANSTLSMK